MADWDGFEGLLSAMDEQRTERSAVTIEDVRLTLQGAKQRGWGFDRAWTAAINRVQPRNVPIKGGGYADAEEAAELLECKALLEEDRPIFRAAYEDRPPSDIERASSIAASLFRLDLAV